MAIHKTVLVLALGMAVSSCTTAAAPEANVGWSDLPSVIDAEGGEAWLTRHPGGTAIVFGRHDEKWQNHRLFMTRLVDGKWSEPEQLPFTTTSDGSAPHFAPDGRSLLFASTRPAGESFGPDRNGNIWRVSWNGREWGEPEPLPSPVNSPAWEIDAVEVQNGAIYLSSGRAGGIGGKPDLYRATPTPGGPSAYQVQPIAELNTAHTESTLYVTPDERLIVFHRDAPDGCGKDDLFAAERQNLRWGKAIHLGAGTNSAEFEYGPEVSPDRSTLYLTTHRSGQGSLIAVNLRQAMRSNGIDCARN